MFQASQQRSEMNDLKLRTSSWINTMKLLSAWGNWLNLILYLTVKSPSCTSLSVAWHTPCHLCDPSFALITYDKGFIENKLKLFQMNKKIISLVAFPISYVASGRVTGIFKQFPVWSKRKLLLDREYNLCSLRRPLHKILLPPYKILEFAINYKLGLSCAKLSSAEAS